ncbi:hypothetical protein C7T35_33160 [Variovorax sp. WS11]|nr:hypothetical protein [Variovorax sp. WS11]NDZ17837.1 hypothetical protein [Variovorax sp. WS11]PSL80263.1 hypothetical protein C7T35_33160 [Variovorax sp. WS11]
MSIAIPKVKNLHPPNALLLLGAVALLVIGLFLFVPQIIPGQKPPETAGPPVAERDKDEAELASRGAPDRDTGSTAPRPTGPATQTLPSPPTSVPGTTTQPPRDLAPAPPPVAAVGPAPEAVARRAAQARAFEQARARQTERAVARAAATDERETWMAAVAPPPPAALVLPDTGTASVASQDQTQTPTATPGASDNEPVVWNYWLTRPSPPVAATPAAPATQGARPRPETGELDLQALHHLNLRLSTLDLSTVLGGVAVVSASPALKETLEAALAESSRKLLELDVLITPSDEQRLRIPMNARRLGMTIDLDGIRSSGYASAAGTTTVTDAEIQKATIAEFGFDFRILVAGTHQASVTIVDKRTALPVQSMVISLKSGVPWPNSVAVDASPQGYFRPAGAPPADLVLVLDALGGEAEGTAYTSLTAKLYHRKTGSPALKEGGDYDVTTWISKYDLTALQRASKGYRETIGDNANAQALLEKGAEFGSTLFNPFDDVEEGAFTLRDAKENSRRAAKARQIIVDTANDPAAKLPPSMVVQIVKDGLKRKHAAPVLPIGAMGIAKEPGQTPIYLGERFALSLSLTDQDYSASRPCPRDWYLALPASTQLKDEALIKALDGLKPMAAGWQTHVQLQTLELSPLKTWLFAPDERSKNLPFVLSYLGHHASGSLSLAKNTAGIGPGGIRRNFQGSSIAILNACDTAMDEIDVGTPIGSLAERRVAAIVATTSPIGGDLAGDYLVCMSSVLAEHQDDLTIGQAHALTTRCLFAKTGDKPGLFNYTGSALKYLLIGNPFQHICAPNPGGAPVLLPATATPIDNDEDQPT